MANLYAKNNDKIFTEGQLASSAYSFSQLSVTSSTLVDFSCRNSWAMKYKPLMAFPRIIKPVHCKPGPNKEQIEKFREIGLLKSFTPILLYQRKEIGSTCDEITPFNMEYYLNRFDYVNGSSKTKHRPHAADILSPLNFMCDSIVSNSAIHQIVQRSKPLLEYPETHQNEGLNGSLTDSSTYDKQWNSLLSTTNGSRSKQKVKKYQCLYCDVGCSNKAQLKGHIRIHTGERPFNCEWKSCGKCFARREELTRHRLIHSGKRPHMCSLCQKTFGRKDHLAKHKKTHLKEPEKKLYICDINSCPQRYTRSDALARHRNSAHSIKPRAPCSQLQITKHLDCSLDNLYENFKPS